MTSSNSLASDEDEPHFPLLFKPRHKPQPHTILWCCGSIVFSVLFMGSLILMSPGLLYNILPMTDIIPNAHHDCSQCRMRLVESIPEGLVYNGSLHNLATFEAWKSLLSRTQTSLELASSYWSLRGKDVYSDPSDWQGEDIFKRIVKATERGVSIKIAQNLPDKYQPNQDTEDLSKVQGVEVRSLNFTALMGAGILHTKLWIGDRRHFYLGSANFDWRSLTQVKEMGILVEDCPCLTEDMAKIFDAYWQLGGPGKIVPKSWPNSLSTDINEKAPIRIKNVESQDVMNLFLSSSPPPFCPEGRAIDYEAIIDTIDQAKKFVHVAVMDYFPCTIYGKSTQFWPIIDDSLRKAAIERHVHVKLLVSQWDHTRADMKSYLESFIQLNGTQRGKVNVQVKFFQVPKFTPAQAKIPFARVNHNKYMVTDQAGYIGTSNWSADYFLNTGGIGVIFQSISEPDGNMNTTKHSKDLRQQLADVFERDWASSYSQFIA